MMWIKTFLILGCSTYVFGLHSSEGGVPGGNYISIKKVPYMASLRLNGMHICGGSIIDEEHILTAARCVVPNQEYQVVVGTDKLHKGGLLYDVEDVIVHPMYSNETFDNDVCILKLNETLTFGEKVDKVFLNDKYVKVKNGLRLKITGWGCTEPQGNVSERLHQVKVRMVARRSCRHALGKNVTLTRSMFCAGGNGRDACKGDDGGPLTWRSVQVGIVSFLGGKTGLPRVYTKITEVLPWITETMGHF